MPKAKTSEKKPVETVSAATAVRSARRIGARPKVRAASSNTVAKPSAASSSGAAPVSAPSVNKTSTKSLAAIRAARASIDSVRVSKRSSKSSTAQSNAAERIAAQSSSAASQPTLVIGAAPETPLNQQQSTDNGTQASALETLSIAADLHMQTPGRATIPAATATAELPECARLDLSESPIDTAEQTIATLVDPESFAQKSASRPFTVSPGISIAQPAAKDRQALASAIQAGDVRTVATMLETDASLAATDAIVDAAGAGRAEIVQLLLDAGADPDHLSTAAHSSRPLHRAIACAAQAGAQAMELSTGFSATDYLGVIRTLLLGGADVRARATSNLVTPIALAAMLGQGFFVRDLLGYCDCWDIFTASALGRADVVWMIVSRDRSSATAVEINGLSALHYCAASQLGATDASVAARLVSVAQRLIAAGADVNAQASDSAGRTPLQWAQGNSAVAQMLIENGARAEVVAASSARARTGKSSLTSIRRANRAGRKAA